MAQLPHVAWSIVEQCGSALAAWHLVLPLPYCTGAAQFGAVSHSAAHFWAAAGCLGWQHGCHSGPQATLPPAALCHVGRRRRELCHKVPSVLVATAATSKLWAMWRGMAGARRVGSVPCGRAVALEWVGKGPTPPEVSPPPMEILYYLMVKSGSF